MRRYRRIEITAFQKRVTVVSGEWKVETSANDGGSDNDTGSRQTIEPESTEGQRILTEAVRMLEEDLGIQHPCKPRLTGHDQATKTPLDLSKGAKQ